MEDGQALGSQGLGVGSPERIEFVTDDPESRAYAAEIRGLLLEG